jgi:hypothetical protein
MLERYFLGDDEGDCADREDGLSGVGSRRVGVGDKEGSISEKVDE